MAPAQGACQSSKRKTSVNHEAKFSTNVLKLFRKLSSTT
jgi:hypothetical protein